MITSKQILEKFLSYKKISGLDEPLSVFENPDTSERQDIIFSAKKTQKGGSGPYIRIIADAKTQKVYAWDAFYAEHIVGRSVAGFPSIDPAKTPWILYGTCKPIGGYKFELVEWDSKPSYKNFKFFSDFFSYNWTWLDKYVDTREYFSDMRRWIETYKKTQGMDF